jgi:predicted dehydrogenase
MASVDRVRLGVIGCGRISSLQVLAYLDDPRAEVVAVCDRDAAAARRSAAEWRARRSYAETQQLLADPEVNAVEILLPHHLHFEVARAALEAGKHVSLQKPPTFTLGELAELRDLARASGFRLRVSENFMYYPPHRKAAELVREGAIGEPISVRIKTAAGRFEDGWSVPAEAQAWRMDPERSGGGPTCFDHGYHCFQMGRFFIREPVERVHGWIHVNRFGPNAVYDGPALIGWRYANVPKFGSWEVVASLGMRVRSRYYATDDRMEIHGLEGILWVNRCTGALLDEPALVLYRDGETRAWHDLPTDWAESFRLAGREFVDALVEGRQPEQDPDDAAETLRFAIAAHLAACEGRDVLLAEVGPRTRARLPGTFSVTASHTRS